MWVLQLNSKDRILYSQWCLELKQLIGDSVISKCIVG